MRRIFAATALSLWAGQTAALSCVASVDPIQSYIWAAESGQVFSVFHGAFSFDPIKMPGFEVTNDPSFVPPSAEASFKGKGLAKTGFVPVNPFTLTVQPACAGPWCGNISPGENLLAFVRKDANGWVLEEGPCGGHIFLDPSDEMLEALEVCIAGGPCKPNTP